jgi:hypothetical protein
MGATTEISQAKKRKVRISTKARRLRERIAEQQRILAQHKTPASKKIYAHIYGDSVEEECKLEQQRKILENVKNLRKFQQQYQDKVMSEK